MSSWVNVKERMPPAGWKGLVVSDVRPTQPVTAYIADEATQKECPYMTYFMGNWRESLLIAEYWQEVAKITHWLETEELYPEVPMEGL